MGAVRTSRGYHVLYFTIALLPAFAPSTGYAQTTVAGFTPGSFQVSPGGAATYTIPIQVPPGIAGMQPQLALSYSSQGGNGLLGMGWALSGLSVIHRCPRTIAQDGVRGGIGYDGNDRYCLDGQRLMSIRAASDCANGTEYRTELESFSRVISCGVAGNGPAWFKVWTKAGQISEYGNTADSRIEVQSGVTARIWALNKISDRKGNYLTVSYTEDTLGAYYPARIDYTGNGAQAPTNSIQFTLEPRNDVSTQYESSPANPLAPVVTVTQRLQKIAVFVPGSPAPVPAVREYRLAYDYGGSVGRSRLVSVKECAGNGTCLSPITFAPQSTGDAAIPSGGPWITTAAFGGPGYNFVGDFDGDGRTDIATASGLSLYLYLGNDDGTFTAKGPTAVPAFGGTDYVWTGDFNGDGKTDIATASGSSLYLYLGSSNGFSVATTTMVPAWGGPGYNFVGDFDGDGKTDIAAASGTSLYLYLGNGSGGFTLANSGNPTIVPTWGSKDYVWVGDFNGDGKTDIATAFFSSLYLYLGNSNGFTVGNTTTVPAWGGPGYNLTGDFNGDGKADIAAASGTSLYLYLGNDNSGFTLANSGNPTIVPTWGSTDYLWVGDYNGDGKADIATASGLSLYLYLGNGNGFTVGNTTTVFAIGGPGYNFVGDFNGDGKTDIAAASGSSLYLYLGNEKNGFTLAPAPGANIVPGGLGGPGFNWIGDFNGDGKTDIIGASGTTAYVYQGGPGWIFPDLLSNITTSLGTGTAITYTPLTRTNPSIYSKDHTAIYPTVDFQSPLYVVSSSSTSNGIGGSNQTNYAYAGAKADSWGRGFLGFRNFTTIDPQTQITTSTTFRQDFPYTGMPSRVEKTAGGVLLNRTDNTPAATAFGGTRFFPFISQSVSSGNDLNGAVLPTVTTTSVYDAYGNPTSIVASTGDGYSKTTTNTYATPDTVNWFIGRLTRSAVTSVMP